MNRLRTILPFVVILALVAGISYGIWSAFAAALTWITTQDAQIAAAIIAFAGTVTVGIGAVVIAQQRSKSREIAESHRPKKIELYNNFILTIIDILRKHKGTDSKALEGDKEIEEFFYTVHSGSSTMGFSRRIAALCHLSQPRPAKEPKHRADHG